jgi:NhaP-type Na+/H+ or K+/H+ antiporter
MAGWSTTRMLDRSTKVVIAAALLAVALIAALPIAFIVALFMMLFGHIIGGLILIGAAVLAAGAAVALAAVSGIRKLRHLRDMLTGESGGRMSRQYLQLNSDDYDTY